MDFHHLGRPARRGLISLVGILVEYKITLFKRSHNGIDFHIATNHCASTIVLILGFLVRTMVMPAYPFHIVVAIGKNRILAEHVGIGASSVVIEEVLRTTVHFEVIQESRRRHLATTFVTCRVIFLFDRVDRRDKRFLKFKSHRAVNLRTVFRSIVRTIAENMLPMVVDRDIGVFHHRNNLFSIIDFQERCFGTTVSRATSQVNTFEVRRIVFIGMSPKRPGTFKSLEIGIVEYQLENQLTRNFELTIHLDGQVITAQTIGLRRTKRDRAGTVHDTTTAELLRNVA